MAEDLSPHDDRAAPGAAATTAELPGRLILVVGPSGAGKDTLIEAARLLLAADPAYVFPRRIVTRPASVAEDNVEAEEAPFLAARERGAFALSWCAHGHWYGVPATIDADLALGRRVVINVSRAVIGEARRRWPDVSVVEVTAPEEVLARRIALRGRPSDGNGSQRLARRFEPGDRPVADRTIDNGSDLDVAISSFLTALTAD